MVGPHVDSEGKPGRQGLRYTWTHLPTGHGFQPDKFLVTQNLFPRVKNCKARPDLDYNSDHSMVVCEFMRPKGVKAAAKNQDSTEFKQLPRFAQGLSLVPTPGSGFPLSSLRDRICEAFQHGNDWEETKTGLQQAMKDLGHLVKAKNRPSWFDSQREELEVIIQAKRRCRDAWRSKRSESAKRTYQKACKDARCAIRQAKADWAKQFAKAAGLSGERRKGLKPDHLWSCQHLNRQLRTSEQYYCEGLAKSKGQVPGEGTSVHLGSLFARQACDLASLSNLQQHEELSPQKYYVVPGVGMGDQ